MGGYLELIDDLEPDIVTAGARRLVSLGRGDLAVRLAISHWLRAPQLANEMQDEIEALVQGLPEALVRIVGFSTTHGLASELGRAFAAVGYRGGFSEADYGQALAELMQPSDAPRDALIILLDLEGLHAPEWRHDANQSHELLLQKLDLLSAGLERPMPTRDWGQSSSIPCRRRRCRQQV